MTLSFEVVWPAGRPKPAPRQAVLELEYQDPGHSFFERRWVLLDDTRPLFLWTIEVPEGSGGAGFYSGQFFYDGGETADIPLTLLERRTEVGGSIAFATVTVTALEIDWTLLSSVEVLLSAETERQTFTFRREDTAARYWRLTASRPFGYNAQVTYRYQDGGVYATGTTRRSSALFAVEQPPPSFHVKLQLEPMVRRLPVTAVRLLLSSGTSQKLTHEFPIASLDQPWAARLWARQSAGGGHTAEFRFEYSVRYDAGVGPDYQSPARTAAGAQEVILGDFGVRLFTSAEVDYDIVQSVAVSYLHKGGSRSFVLDRNTPKKILIAGRDYDPDEPLRYDLDYKIADGNYLNVGLISNSSWIPVPYPFRYKRVIFLPAGLNPKSPTVLRIQLQFEHHEEGAGWKIGSSRRTAVLDATRRDCEWTFLAVDPERALMRYSGTTIMKSGTQVPIARTECNLPVIPVGDTPGWNSVTISPAQVHWTAYELVVAVIFTRNEANQRTNLAEFRFAPESLSEYWGYFGPASEYYWSATYYERSGESVPIPEQSGFSPLLTLPSEPERKAEWATSTPR